MKRLTKKDFMLLQEQVERLQNQLDDEKANNKLLEDALDKSLLKMDLILAAISLRCSASGRLQSDLTSPAPSNNSRTVSSMLRRVNSSLLTIGAGTMSPEWKVQS